MQIAKSTDFALRVLIFSATHPDTLVTQQEVADFFDISREHLRKIVHELSKADYLKTQRGKQGGFKLAKAPMDINIADIVTLFEGKQCIIDCADLNCVLVKNCQLNHVFQEAENAFMNSLKNYSLADIISKPMRRILTA